ncbi:MAG: hypothetical protein BWY78_01009 [Alphaproteobacteria bacterium ADurb.Bin438]|nr:MAG: hypothetical protein BWY78_01009 [Alphaproteobacteria bacterium ADurb.Bin438]
MVDLERENAVLALQLKREQLQTEIEELKATQRDQIMVEIERREELAKARIEWEKDQEIKLLESRERLERQRIREKQIDAVIARNEEDRRIRAEEEKRRIEAEQERKLQEHLEQIRRLNEEEANRNAGINSQNSSSNSSNPNSPSGGEEFWGGSSATPQTPAAPVVAAAPSAAPSTPENTPAGSNVDAPSNAIVEPVADTSDVAAVTVEVPEEPKASEKYYVVEVRGVGDDLVAKLSDKEATSSFFVRIGSTLATGHEVTDITREYVEAKLNDKIDQIGFLFGGVAYNPNRSNNNEQ